MEIEKSPLYKEVKEIIDEGPKPVSFYWKVKIHVGENEFEPIKLLDLDFKKDYSNNYADEITVRLFIPLGLWAKQIYPSRTKLEMTLIKKPIKEIDEDDKKDEEIESMKFTAVPVINEQLPVLTGKHLDHFAMWELDLKSAFEVDFQLFDKSIEKLRMVTVGGIFRRTNAEDVIKSILATESGKVKIETGKTFEGVDIIEPNNKDKREHFLIPHGTKLFDVPDYIQHKVGGVYSTGINCYFHNKFWFVYPLYDTTRLEKAKKTAVIMKVPKNRYNGMERTYRQDGDTLYIIGTSESEFSDDAGTNFTNTGNGVRFSDSRRFMRDIVQKKDNKAIISRKKVNHEYAFKKHKEDVKEEGKELFNVQLSNARINSNPYSEQSVLSSKYGALYRFEWENADPSLLFPGMMIKIHYIDKDVMRELHGVLIFAHSSIQIRGQGVTTNRHINTVAMIIYANKPPGSSQENQETESEDDVDTKEIARWADYRSL